MTVATFGTRRAVPTPAETPSPLGASKDMKDTSARPSFIKFLDAIRGGDHTTLEKVYKTGFQSSGHTEIRKAAMGENSGTLGGYLVPLEYSTRLLNVISEESFLYPRATVIPMGAAETICPKIDVETVQAAGTSPFFGGIKYLWGSSQAPTQTEPKFRALTLKAWDLLGYATVSNQWYMDILGAASTIPDLGATADQYMLNLFGKAAAWYAEYAFLRGTGTAQSMPLGILNAPGAKLVTRAGANDIALADISAMTAGLLPFSWKNGIWACSPTCLDKIVKLSTFQLNYNSQSNDGSVGSLVTLPLFITEKLPALGTKGDLILIDPSLYIIGNRMQVMIDVSMHVGFTTNQTDFRVWLRMDGRPMVGSTITLQDATTVVSPFVILN